MKWQLLPKLKKEELQAITLPKFVEKFLPTFNLFIDQAASVLTANVSLLHNTAGKYVVYENVKGSFLTDLNVPWDRKDLPIEIRLCQLVKTKAGSGVVSGGSSGGTIGADIGWSVGTAIPSYAVEKNGQALAVADYPELYAIIGNTFDTQTDPTTGGLWASPGAGFFRVPDTRGLFDRHAGTSVAMISSPGTRSVAVGVGMVQDDKTAKNGLGGASTPISASGSGSTGNQSVGHTHGVSISSGTESADHSHSGATNTDGAHSHTSGNFNVNGPGNPYGFAAFVTANSINIAGQGMSMSVSSGSSNHSHGFSTGGRSAAHSHAVNGNTSGISANHNHTITLAVSGSLTPNLGAGDTETCVRARGKLMLIQVRSIAGSGDAVPSVDPRWSFDGEKVKAKVLNVEADAFYTARLFIQS